MHTRRPLPLLLQATTLLLCSLKLAIAIEPSSEPLLRIEPGIHTANIRRIATDAKGRWLVTASDDKTARVWDLANGRLLNTLRPPIGLGNEGRLYAVAISPDGETVALSGWMQFNNGSGSISAEGMDIFLYERTTGHLLRRITGLPNAVLHLAFAPDGHSLAATLFANNGLRLFSVADGSLIGEDTAYGNNSYSVQFGPSIPTENGYVVRMVTTSDDGLLRLYHFDGKKLQLVARQRPAGGTRPRAARFSPDGLKIALGFADTTSVNVLDTRNLSLLYAADVTGANSNLGYGVAWSQDGSILSAAGEAHKQFNGQWKLYIRSWENGGKGRYEDLPAADDTIMDMHALPAGKLAFSSAASNWGVMYKKGGMSLSQKTALPDFRDFLQGFSLSADGSKVRFGYGYGGANPVVFDTRGRSFLPADTAGLSPARQSGETLKVSDWNDTPVPKLNNVQLRLDPYELSRSVAVFPNETGIALGAEWYLRAFDPKGNELWRQAAPGVVWSVNISADGRYVVAAYGDGTIRWHRASDGVEQLAFFPHADKKRWIMWTPEGYYDASPGGEDLIGWHLNQGKDKEARFIPSGQLYDVFFRPDIVQAKLNGDDISGLITLTASQALKYPPPVMSFTKVPSSSKSNVENVCYKAIATGGGIGEVRLFQNGKLIKSDGFYREGVAKVDSNLKLAAMDSATVTRALKLTKTEQKSEPPMVSNNKGNEYAECQEIETIPGENEISVAAFNANNTVQSKLESVSFKADRKAEAPHLYVLGIGIDQYTAKENNLSYAVKDATDFRSMIQSKATGLYQAGNIHIEGLSNAQATKAGIQKAIQTISSKVKPWDSFILFVASHGYLQDNQYYIVTSEFDGVVNTANMISSNEIVGMSKNIKSLAQLLIFDTCHAGGVDNIIGGLYDARMSVMAKKMGLHIYASAGGTQTALDGYQGNGLFTHALLKSMKADKTTDSNHDKLVSVAELGEQAKEETITISKKLGFPQSPNIINFGKDNALFKVR